MEKEQDKPKAKYSMSKGHVRTIKITILIVLTCFPIIFLIYKTTGLPEKAEKDEVSRPSINDIASLETAVKTNPTADNLINLSIAYINTKKPGKSINHLKRAIELSPNNAIAYNNLGVAYIMLQQYQDGINACEKALQIDPAFQLAKNNLRWANDEKNKVINEIHSQEQIPLSKRDIAFYSAYGLNYFKIGDYGKSIEIWNMIFDIDPKNVGALNSIGTAFMMKGQIDDAKALYGKALVLEPNNQLVKNNLAWAIEEKSKAK